MVREEKGKEWFRRDRMFSKPNSDSMFIYFNRKEKRGACLSHDSIYDPAYFIDVMKTY